MAFGLLLWSTAPAFFGWYPTVTMSGSMEPRLLPGDIVISKPITRDELHPGMILLVDDPVRPDSLLVHRLVEDDPDRGLILKGDANQQPDSDAVDPKRLRGLAVLRVPWIARPVYWWHTGHREAVALTAIAGAVLLTLANLYTPLPRPERPPGPREGRRSARVTGRRTAWWRALRHRPLRRPRRRSRHRPRHAGGTITTTAVTALVLGLTCLGAARTGGPPVAASAFSKTTANTSNSLASGYFTCANAALASNPLLLYNFDETSGSTAADASGHANTGTHQNSNPGFSSVCAAGGSKSVWLDGSNDYVSTTTKYTNPQTFSVEVWFKSSASNGGKIAGFGSWQTGSSFDYDRHVYLRNDGKVSFGVWNGAYRVITSPSAYNDGSWHLVVATLSAATGTRLYLDGALVAQDLAATSAENFDGYWRFGYDSLSGWPGAPSNYFFTGYLDGAAVFNTVLSLPTIALHYGARG